jgi:hypothetical protein
MGKRKNLENSSGKHGKNIRLTAPNSRRYHHIGRFDSEGPAAIVTLADEDTRNIEWRNLRVFFLPDRSGLCSLRIKPSQTYVYGPFMKVFVIPPAPDQWKSEIQKMRQQGNLSADLFLHVELFLEDVSKRKYQPYGSVVYIFREKRDWSISTLSHPETQPPGLILNILPELILVAFQTYVMGMACSTLSMCEKCK